MHRLSFFSLAFTLLSTLLAALGYIGNGAAPTTTSTQRDARLAALETTVATLQSADAEQATRIAALETRLAGSIPTTTANAAVAATTVTPSPTNAPATAAQTMNRRQGPGTDYPLAGVAKVGEPLDIVGQSADGAWYLLADGAWVFGQLVANPPDQLPVVTPTPAGETRPAQAVDPAPSTTAVTGRNASMVGDAAPALPAPTEEEFDVIILKRFDQRLTLFVRNNTPNVVKNIGVDAVVRAADGSLLAVNQGIGFRPALVRPGEVTYGGISFGDITLPDDAQFEFEVTAGAATADEGAGDLQISEHNFVQNRFVGMLVNSGPQKVNGPIRVQLLCFDADGAYLAEDFEFTTKNEVEPDASIPFQVQVSDSCPTYLIFATGFVW